MNGRIRPIRFAAIALVGVIGLSACDTGDGKDLKAYDPADYPSQTVAPASMPDTVDDGVADEFDLGDGDAGEPNSHEPFRVAAPWTDGATLDAKYTCDGADVAPAISWGAVPAGTVEIAVALVDESSVSEGQPFVHWVIGGLDAGEIALAEGDVPDGAVQALNFFGDVGYRGPCPPEGDAPHLYRLTAYALNQRLDRADGTPASEFLDTVALHTIESTDVSGLYGR